MIDILQTQKSINHLLNFKIRSCGWRQTRSCYLRSWRWSLENILNATSNILARQWWAGSWTLAGIFEWNCYNNGDFEFIFDFFWTQWVEADNLSKSLMTLVQNWITSFHRRELPPRSTRLWWSASRLGWWQSTSRRRSRATLWSWSATWTATWWPRWRWSWSASEERTGWRKN